MTLREQIEETLDKRDLAFGEIHAQGRDVTVKDLKKLNSQTTDQLLALFKKEMEGIIGYDDLPSLQTIRVEDVTYNPYWIERNLMKADMRHRLSLLTEEKDVK